MNEADSIKYEQVKLLYSPILGSTALMVVAAYILAYIQSDVIHVQTLITWLSAISIVFIARIILYFSYKKKAPTLIILYSGKKLMSPPLLLQVSLGGQLVFSFSLTEISPIKQ